MLDYFPNADHAGIYAAQGRRRVHAAPGSTSQIQTPSDPAAPLKLLAAGKVDLAISYEPELLLARDKGLKLVAVGALVQKPLTSIMSIGKHAIADPKDLKGKTRRHGRHPLPVRLPEDDPRRARASTRRRSRRSTSASTSSRR